MSCPVQFIMQELFALVLNDKDLSKAGELFSLEDKDIQHDLTEVLERICQIVDSFDYVTSSNDQSVVEICVTRVTSAIRETDSISSHVNAMISLLEVCLKYNLQPSGKDEDPAHAKIASDVLSCLFMNYTKKGVMEIALPVVVQFLDCENKELVRNVSSYLSLAAIGCSSLLASYMELIISSVLKGNSALTLLLQKVYPDNKQVILDHVPELVRLMDTCELQESISLIQMFAMVAKENPRLLQPYVPVFCDYLKQPEMAPTVLNILVDIASVNPRSLLAYVTALQTLLTVYPVYTEPAVAIIGSIATLSENDAKRSLQYFMGQLPNADKTTLPLYLNGLKMIAASSPHLLGQHMPEINKHCQNKPYVADLLHQLREDLKKRSATCPETEEMRKKYVSFEGEELRKKFVTFSEGDIHLSGSTSSLNTDPIFDRPTSPSFETMVSDIPLSNSLTSTATNPSCPSPVSSMKELYRDVVQQFCEKHLGKIRVFINNVTARLPSPVKCSVVNGRHKRYVKLNFVCSSHRGDECLYSNNCFVLITHIPKTWIHLMFLALQAKAISALGQQDTSVSCLKRCWDALKSEKGPSSFLTVVTSSFPSAKDQDALLHELHSVRYFDVFEFNAAEHHWACFMCNHPEKMVTLLQDGSPFISGQLKEKKGRWKFLKRWKTRYFSLSGSNITYSKGDSHKETLPVSKIQSVKALRKGIRDIPKAFEIFTADQRYVLKAKDEQNVEQWVQCLQIAVARSQQKEPVLAPLTSIENQ
ncbi:zone-expressed PH domain-containing homolog 1-like [Octopus vulgaris]|uniref:Zone-expressed PH domain-containing homolog 1-like n=1 Tax=Octopus vulgaris TaxID=6645 RepID=A0AA36EZI5_OCTVU|nr:zone-expressed PH domain-containing homolog 1-like [Octopus vulgaris]